MKTAVFLTLISLTLGGCITDTGEQLPEPWPVSVDSIKGLTIRRQVAYFVVCCTIPEPCWVFVRSDYSISGRSIAVTIYARRRNNDPCIQVLSSLDAPATIVVPSSGTYTFRFWRYGGQTLDTTLTFQ